MIAAWLVTVAAAATAQGFTPADAARHAQRELATGATERAPDALERLRVALIVNPTAAAAALPASDRAILEQALGRIDDSSAHGISWFLRVATTVVRGGEGAQTLWYNPVVDVAVAARWRRLDGRWRLIAAQLVDGTALRRGELAGLWSDVADGSYQAAFASRAVASLAAPSASVGAADVGLLARRVALAQRGLAALRAAPAASSAAAAVTQALTTAKPRSVGLTGANAPDAAMLDALPPAVRQSLAVVASYLTANGRLLLIASPLRPDLVFFVDLDAADRATLVAPVNLANRPEPRS